ncbi:type II secretion system F family protein [Terrabacter sp. MAHUQ-38]|uniref:type II secretion system F family protein n=1 Tax=unclassified Terrabacter TaxID=2630222 RepID=UPI00165E1231|nr:hypothetical protein [Terrabacter sp. MAHUQ-38]MBC9822464.1 hypothetical protein [Terrabacter sp. MAHUQ-38]
MSAMASGAVAALLVGVAVVVWPRTSRVPSPAVLGPSERHTSNWQDAAGQTTAGQTKNGAFPGGSVSHPAGDEREQTPSLWQQDPVDLYRRWRLRRRPGELVDDVLDLLRGIAPGLESGLTPSRAIDLAATSGLGPDRVALARQAVLARRRRTTARGASAGQDIDLLVGQLLHVAEHAQPLSPIWAEWAQRSASAELRLVAAAWRLSERTGAPLASAVDRAVRGLLDARARRGKVAVAVAGPRATVTVLTVLPLTGPLFGMACGIDPVTLYLGSPVATISAASGITLGWAGRAWCRRMIRSAVRP